MSERSVRRFLSSPAAAPLPDDDDMLQEIFLRLPPLPSSLPRASLVCKRWRRLLSDPHFLRRFRKFHHREPPLHGFFIMEYGVPNFTPLLDAPDRIPAQRFYLPLPRDWNRRFLGCRHGLTLIVNVKRLEITVWDPVTGDQRCVALPPAFNQKNSALSGALLCCAGQAGRMPIESFKVVMLRTDDVRFDAAPHAYAFLYQSETGVWDNPISTSVKSELYLGKPNVLVGNSLYWFLHGDYHGNSGILEFDLDKNILAEFSTPVGTNVTSWPQIVQMEDRRLGIAMVSDLSIQLWSANSNVGASATWTLQKSIDLDKLLPLRSLRGWHITLLGYDEDGHVIFVKIDGELYMIQLKSLEFKHLFREIRSINYHPYRSLYTTGRGISGDFGAKA